MSPNWENKSKLKRKNIFVMRILRIRLGFMGKKWKSRVRIWSQGLGLSMSYT